MGWEEASGGRTSLEEWRDPEWEGTARTLKEQIVFQAECRSCVGLKCCLSHDVGLLGRETPILQRPGQWAQ